MCDLNTIIIQGPVGRRPTYVMSQSTLISQTQHRAFPPSDGPGSITASDPWVVATTNLKPGDFNQDGHVDTADIGALEMALNNLPAYLTTYGLTASEFLQVGNIPGVIPGIVNNAELQALLNYIQNGGGSTTTVPEPTSWVLLALATTGLYVARWCRCRSPSYGRGPV